MKSKTKWISHKELKAGLLKAGLLKDPGFRHEYEKLETEFQIARQIIGARIKNRMSQEELAKKAGTGQAVISRLEGMNAKPSISLLARVARALNTKINITIQ